MCGIRDDVNNLIYIVVCYGRFQSLDGVLNKKFGTLTGLKETQFVWSRRKSETRISRNRHT